MRTKQHRKSPVHAPADVVTDTAILLQQCGVHQIDYKALDDIVHSKINCQSLVDWAQYLFEKRRFQGLITLDGLVGAMLEQAA